MSNNNFLIAQLGAIKEKIKKTIYENTLSVNLLPINTDAGYGAEGVAVQELNISGQAQIIADYAGDMPMINAQFKEVVLPVRSIAAAFSYTLQEVRMAEHKRIDLNASHAESTRYSIEQKIDDIAWVGDSDFGLYGLATYPNIEEVEASIKKGESGWAKKSPQEILDDLYSAVEQLINKTNGMVRPDTMVMPTAQYNKIVTTYYGDFTGTTILDAFKRLHPNIKVHPIDKLKGMGSGKRDLLIVYKNSRSLLALELPVPYEQFEPQMRGLTYYIYAHARSAGLAVYNRDAILKFVGI